MQRQKILISLKHLDAAEPDTLKVHEGDNSHFPLSAGPAAVGNMSGSVTGPSNNLSHL